MGGRLRRQLGVRSQTERAGRSVLRLAWRTGVPHENPDPAYRGAPLSDPLLAVLGMHRSGTSAVVGMLEDQGFSTGLEDEDRWADNPFGTREDRDLVRLDNALLNLNGCTWDRPPRGQGLHFTARQLSRRERVVAKVAKGPAVLKDPRMVLLREFWSGVPLMPIGVIRNPIAVADSLRRREPKRTSAECVDMWQAYNSHLLRWLEASPFPVVEFGDVEELTSDLERALAWYGLDASHSFRFFDRSLVRSVDQGTTWRRQVPSEALRLWERLISLV